MEYGSASQVKRNRKNLLLELEKYAFVAELIGLNEEELCSRTTLQATFTKVKSVIIFRKVNLIGCLWVMRTRVISTAF